MKRVSHLVWSVASAVFILVFPLVGYLLNLEFGRIGLFYLTAYGLIAVVHFILQIIYAGQNERQVLAAQALQADPSQPQARKQLPLTAVVIPCYREDPDALRLLLTLLSRQVGARLAQVILVADGHEDYLQEIFEQVAGEAQAVGKPIEWQYIGLPQNRGKRFAMKAGFDAVRPDIEVVVNMDSDTTPGINTLWALTNIYAANRAVWAATGDVRVANHDRNLLTRLTAQRYWYAFNLERAAQSRFGVVTCMSGPLMSIRKEALDAIKEQWFAQRFLGQRCTYGDDRHLTTLALKRGYHVAYIPNAVVYTDAPHNLFKFIRQQTRWSRSFWRENLLSLPWMFRQHPWLSADAMYQLLFPLLLAVNIGIITYQAVTVDVRYLLGYLAVLALFSLARSWYGVLRTNKREFWLFSLYSAIYVTILLPIKVWALFSLWNTGWGTKPVRQQAQAADQAGDLIARTIKPVSAASEPMPEALEGESYGLPLSTALNAAAD